MYPQTRGAFNYRPTPCVATSIDDLNPKFICVRCDEIHSAAYAGTTVSTVMAVRVVMGSAIDEAGECGMDDGIAIRVGARLETSVTDIRLANEVELLGKIIAGSVGGVCDGEWERNSSEPRTGDVGYAP